MFGKQSARALLPRTRSAGVIAVLTGGMVLAMTGAATAASAVSSHASSTTASSATAYVADPFDRTLSDIDTATGTVTGHTDTDLPHGIGWDPQSESVSPDGKTIYVSGEQDGFITVVDASSHQAVDDFRPCQFGVVAAKPVFTPDGANAYLICDDRVYDINTATRVSTLVPGQTTIARAFAMSPDGTKLYVTIRGGTVDVIDTATNTITTTIDVGTLHTWENQILVSPTGDRFYVDSLKGVREVNTKINAVRTIAGTTGLNVLALSADGKTLVGTSGNHTLAVINTVTDTVTTDTVPGTIWQSGYLTFSPTNDSLMYLETQDSSAPYHYHAVALDTATGTFTTATTMATQAFFIAFSPDGRTVYTAGQDGTSLIAVDAATGRAAALGASLTFNIGGLEFADGQIFVYSGYANGLDTPGQVWVINAETGFVITTIESKRQSPKQVVVTPDGSTAYVSGDDEILAIDTATDTITAAISMPQGVESLAISPDGGTIYAAGSSNTMVYAISTATNTVRRWLYVPYAPNATSVSYREMAVSPDGGKLYVTNQASVSAVDTTRETILRTFAIGGEARSISLSSDGSVAYLPLAGFPAPGQVEAVDTATGSAIAVITVGQNPVGSAVTPDGKTLYVATGSSTGTVYVIDTATNAVTGTVTVGRYASDVAISPDGMSVYVTNAGDGTVSAINTATNTVTSTIAIGTETQGIAFPA